MGPPGAEDHGAEEESISQRGLLSQGIYLTSVEGLGGPTYAVSPLEDQVEAGLPPNKGGASEVGQALELSLPSELSLGKAPS